MLVKFYPLVLTGSAEKPGIYITIKNPLTINKRLADALMTKAEKVSLSLIKECIRIVN